ncbi:MAG: hypothetical protein ABI707_16755 [Ferruginibacter sp.]
MQELITRITEKAGISTEQATTALETVKDYVKEKFPMMAGAVDNLFASGPEVEGSANATITTAGATTVIPDPAAPEAPKPTMLDKISDVIPGETGQKVEDFVKGAAHKAEDVYDNVKEKLGGMFGGDKK